MELDEVQEILVLVTQLLLSRNGDVTLDDGDFATVDINMLLYLEESLIESLGLKEDNISSSNADRLISRISSLKF